MKRCRDLFFALCMPLCVLLLCSVLMFPGPSARAETSSGTCGREGDNLSWTLDENGVPTIAGEGDMADFPENSTRPWPVASVTSLILSDGVASIGDFAFFGCRRLESVSLPETLRFIGTRAFFYCSRLQSIELPDSVTELGENPFAHCSALEHVAVGPGNPALAIHDGALLSPADARMIWYPNHSTRTEFKVPEGICALDGYAFSFCRSLRMVELPDTLMSIGARAFDGCASLRALTLPAELSEIGGQAFAGCSGLPSLIIPEGVSVLGPYTFAHCSGLDSIIVPDSVKEISETAFYRCFNLKLVVGEDSTAERICIERGLPYILA